MFDRIKAWFLLWKIWRYLFDTKLPDLEVEDEDAKIVKYTLKDIQAQLTKLGYPTGPVDGKSGPKTLNAIKKFQVDHNLSPDGLVGPLTISALFGSPVKPAVIAGPNFDLGSARRLAKAHPLIQKLMTEARKKVPFQILDSQRGRAAQEKAFRTGHSKAHFGQSAHNWEPAVAVDITPLPLNWKDIDSFVRLSKVILPLAKEMNIPIEWGGNWKSFKDYPHYELSPWRSYAKNLIGGK